MKQGRLRVFALFISVAVIWIWLAKTGGAKFTRLEEPFSSIRFPLRYVDASIVMSFGDQINGRSVILVRVTDDLDQTYNFAILNDGEHGTHQTVLKNLNLDWCDLYGCAGLAGTGEADSFPEVFFDHKPNFDLALFNREAFDNLIFFLSKFKEANSHRTQLALEQLTKDKNHQ